MKSFDAVVIGSGPGGYVCAIRLGQLGVKTAIVEMEKVGGVCLNVGCIPSKALIHAAEVFHQMTTEAAEIGITAKGVSCDFEKTQEWKNGVVKKLTGGVQNLLKMNKVELIQGKASFVDSKTIQVEGKSGKEQISSKNFVIATGSRTIELPFMKFNGKNVVSSTEALEFKEVPKSLIVVGGGFIGIEIGMAYAKLGSEVTIAEALPALLATIDQELVAVVTKRMKDLGIKVYTSTQAKDLKEKGKTLQLEVLAGDKKETLQAEVVLVSVGRRPNSDGLGLERAGVRLDAKGNISISSLGETSTPGIFAIGDVTGPPQLAHRAMMDGMLVASTISGEKAFRDYRVVPWAVFSDPEIAVCGLTEKEAQEKGLRVKVGKFPFVASGRALSTNATSGLVKVIINEKDESIVGVHIAGADASNLIAEAAIAMEMGATAEDILRTIHTHPTLAETLPEAIEAATGKAIHIYKPVIARTAQRPNANA